MCRYLHRLIIIYVSSQEIQVGPIPLAYQKAPINMGVYDMNKKEIVQNVFKYGKASVGAFVYTIDSWTGNIIQSTFIDAACTKMSSVTFLSWEDALNILG